MRMGSQAERLRKGLLPGGSVETVNVLGQLVCWEAPTELGPKAQAQASPEWTSHESWPSLFPSWRSYPQAPPSSEPGGKQSVK